MSYSDEALIFQKIPVDHQVRLEDRVSYLYLEYSRIHQTRTGVVASIEVEDEEREKVIPLAVGGIALLMLGPGTSITHAALASCARAGTTVLVTGGGGMPCYTHATPLTTSSRWAIAQARLIADDELTRRAALTLYGKQLGKELPDTLGIRQMRGIEGRIIRQRYRELALANGVSGFRRDTKAEDPVNQALNLVHGTLYGCAASACSALGVNPALGIIHRGDQRSLLFDLADIYKPTLSMPIAFQAANEAQPLEYARKTLRQQLYKKRVLGEMLRTLMELFTPLLPSTEGDRLIDDDGDVAGHKQYGR
ncbi:MAG: type I-E CRISPR-associated endonuclease Cas1e [Flaviflexus sp.]|nr:type I-E CRISPR-associated endonuclease Cas1e [Flaviflexus sp.]